MAVLLHHLEDVRGSLLPLLQGGDPALFDRVQLVDFILELRRPVEFALAMLDQLGLGGRHVHESLKIKPGSYKRGTIISTTMD